MLKVFIDIETLPEQNPNMEEYKVGVKAPAQYKKADSIQKWLDENANKVAEENWLKTSFDGGKGQICCIGWACHNMKSGYTITGSEVEILNKFNEMMVDRCGGLRRDGKPRKGEVMFIAHNAKFDLPFLHKRFVINKIKPQFKTVWNGRHGQHHFCTMEEWAGFNGRISQDNLCKILGLPTKDGMDGSQVWPEYQKGNIDKIAKYCKSDVETVIEMYKRLTWAEL